MDEQELLDQVSRWKKEYEDLRLQYDNRWSKNLKLLKGIFSEEENNRSRVRNRSKIFFRKIWATKFRLLSAFYKVFLQDLDTFTIKERGPEDELKARVLQKMTEYRRDFMMNNHNLFLKFIWAMSDITDYGWCVGKLHGTTIPLILWRTGLSLFCTRRSKSTPISSLRRKTRCGTAYLNLI